MKYPLQLYIIWAESPKEKEARCSCYELAQAIFSTFHRKVEEPTARGIGIPVYLVSKATAVEKAIEWNAAEQTLLVWMVTDKMVGQAEDWREALKEVLIQDKATLIPVALTNNYHKLGEQFGNKDWISLENEKEDKRKYNLLNNLALNIIQQLQQPNKDTELLPLNLFISYAKSDGKDFVKALRSVCSDFGEKVKITLETLGRGAANTFDAKTKARIQQSVFLVVYTKDYQEQELFLKKLLFAKKEQRPIVLVDIAAGWIPRRNPYLGNAPTVYLPSSRGETKAVLETVIESTLITTVFLEALRYVYQGAYLTTYKKYLKQATTTFSIAPELLTLHQKNVSSKNLVLYPDPPLGSIEVNLLETYANTQIITPTLFPTLQLHLQENSCRAVESYKTLLCEEEEEIIIGFSVSTSTTKEDKPFEGINRWHVQDAMVELARYLLASGGRCAYGGLLHYKVGDSNYTQILADLLKSYNEEEHCQKKIINHTASLPMLQEDNDVSVRANYIDAIQFIEHDISPLNLDENGYTKAKQVRALSYLRRIIFEDYNDAQIFIGGKMEGYQGILPGLLEEAYWALYKGGSTADELPIYILGGFGGMSAALAELFLKGDSPTLKMALETRQKQPDWADFYQAYCDIAQASGHWQEQVLQVEARTHYIALKLFFLRYRNQQGDRYLDNGLSKEENEVLFQSTNTLQISSLILKGLYNYFIL